jgi:YD repeat-containing protein
MKPIFMDITSAKYKRRKYDELGADWNRLDQQPGRRAGGFRGDSGDGSEYHFEDTGYSDFFEQFFGSRGHTAGGAFAQQGQDIESDILVTLNEALHGSTRTINLQRVDSRTGQTTIQTLRVKIPPGVHEAQLIVSVERVMRVLAGAFLATSTCEFSSPSILISGYSTLYKNSDNSYSLVETEGLTRNFASSGQITSVVDRNGNTLSFAYTNGTLATVTDPNGRSVSFSYDAGGKLSAITDPMGNRYTLTYTNGALASIAAPDGGSWNYLYGNGNVLTTKTDPGGNSSSYAYDANNRVTTAVDPQLKWFYRHSRNSGKGTGYSRGL